MVIDYLATFYMICEKLELTKEELEKRFGILMPIEKLLDRQDYADTLKEKIVEVCKENNLDIIKYQPDFDIINRYCNLNPSDDDLSLPQDEIKYDSECAFEKYYNIDTIIGAFKKFVSKEWSKEKLASWICKYNYIINGGFDLISNENFTSLKQFIIDTMSWSLDGLSFIDKYDYEEKNGIEYYIDELINFDHILKTIDNWTAYYAAVGNRDEDDEEQYVILVNNIEKEYIIVFSMFLKNGYKDEYFKFVSENELYNFVDTLKNKKYKLLPYSEEFFYEEKLIN